MKKVQAATRRVHVEREAVDIRRRFLPAHVPADIRDHELMTAPFERVPILDSDCLPNGSSFSR